MPWVLISPLDRQVEIAADKGKAIKIQPGQFFLCKEDFVLNDGKRSFYVKVTWKADGSTFETQCTDLNKDSKEKPGKNENESKSDVKGQELTFQGRWIHQSSLEPYRCVENELKRWPKALKTESSGSKSQADTARNTENTLNATSAARWLVHPGDMSGDLWHIVGALHFDPQLKLFLPYDSSEGPNFKGLQGLIKSLNLDKDKDRIKMKRNNGAVDNSKARDLASQAKIDEGDLCGHTWASTSILNAAAIKNGTPTVIQELQTLFARNQCGHEEQYAKHALMWLTKLDPKKRYVLVNMRWAAKSGQNPQHNIKENIFLQIAKVAEGLNYEETASYELVRIGKPELRSDATKDCDWISKLSETLPKSVSASLAADIYADAGAAEKSDLWKAINDHKLLQAYFWRTVVRYTEKRNIWIRMIGGRSGGMDIASFMGLKTASWDQVNEKDYHYMRLHWACPFNSIIRYDASSGLDPGALELWMRGEDIVPVLPSDPKSGAPVGTFKQYVGEKDDGKKKTGKDKPKSKDQDEQKTDTRKDAYFEALWYEHG